MEDKRDEDKEYWDTDLVLYILNNVNFKTSKLKAVWQVLDARESYYMFKEFKEGEREWI